MNDAPSSGSPTNPEAGPSNNHEASPAALSAGTGSSDPAERRKRSQKAQKTAFLDHLIRQLDIVIFCELSILYYMDCSLLYFLLRAIPHWFYFTPKPDMLPPPPMTIHRPYVGTIFGSNLICILLHIIYSAPMAGEASHRYLHGGMIIDFVGQISPVGRWKLVGLDVLILGLQVMMMCLTLEKHSLLGKKATTSIGGRETAATRREEISGQDLDAEERGVLGFENSDGANGIEMQDLRSGESGRTGSDEDRERDELLAHDLQEEERNEHPLDPFFTGDHVLVKLRLLDTIRAQWRRTSLATDPANAAATTASMQTAAGDFVGRRIQFTWGGRTAGDVRTA